MSETVLFNLKNVRTLQRKFDGKKKPKKSLSDDKENYYQKFPPTKQKVKKM